jgi:hypothetical protein
MPLKARWGKPTLLWSANTPAPSCVAMNFREGLVDYSVRYWLTNPLQDDPTDSQVRIHIYAALQRNGFKLAPPQLAIDLTTESSERDQAERAKELALRKRTLKKIELFSGFSDDELGEIAGTLTFATFARGDVITRQGAIAHWLYILISGEADVWFEAATHQRRHLTTLPTGRVFGEMGLMTGEARRRYRDRAHRCRVLSARQKKLRAYRAVPPRISRCLCTHPYRA